jgi:hypothetical protein
MREAIAASGQDIADFGIEGLSMDSSVANADEETLRKWVDALRTEAAKSDYYQTEAAEGIRDANILRYTTNQASFNAQQAANQDSEFADEHQEALLL